MASVTVLDICTEVLSLLQVYAPGEPIDPADTASLLFTLGGIVDGWGAEALTIFDQVVYTFNTTAGQAVYTFGPDLTNNWVSPAGFPLPVSLSCTTIYGGVEIGIHTSSEDEWKAIALKLLQGGGPITNFWPQYGAVFHVFNFYPVPAGAVPVVLYVDRQIPRFTALSNTVVFPPGYQEALVYELTIKAQPKFGAPLPSWLPAAWALAKSRVKESNFEAIDLKCDPALVGTGRHGGGSIAFYEGK
jgi:hypothetical protein